MNSYTAGKIFKVLGCVGLIGIIIFFSIAILLSGGAIILPNWSIICNSGIATIFFPFGLSIFYLIIGKAIQKHKEWARIVGIIMAILISFAFPIGTLIGGYILWCLIKGWNVK